MIFVYIQENGIGELIQFVVILCPLLDPTSYIQHIRKSMKGAPVTEKLKSKRLSCM